jgi:hypothetical protein
MALIDTSTVIPGVGHFLIAALGATDPTWGDIEAFAADITDVPTGFEHFGHTDIDEVVAFDSEGGETEVKGSWQNPSLREVLTDAAVDYLVFRSLQVRDNDALTLFYGGGDVSVANQFGLPDNPAPQERYLVLVMMDAYGPIALRVPKASLRREGAMQVDRTDFIKMPIRATYLQASGKRRAYWMAEELGAAV